MVSAVLSVTALIAQEFQDSFRIFQHSMQPHTAGLARPGVAVLMSVRAVILPLSQVSALVCTRIYFAPWPGHACSNQITSLQTAPAQFYRDLRKASFA